MATPDFIRELRATAGQQLLFLPGISAVVVDDDGRVLLHRRADTGRWSIVGGIPEPGEQPAQTAVREVYEEAGVVCTAERVLVVEGLDPIQYPNGDRCQFMDISLRCRATGGTARVNDDEGLEVGWFEPDALPAELEPFARHRIRLALSNEPTWFATAAAPGAGAAEPAPAATGAETAAPGAGVVEPGVRADVQPNARA